jgi:hypothetical protein
MAVRMSTRRDVVDRRTGRITRECAGPLSQLRSAETLETTDDDSRRA